jgi:hypothetical protein
MKLDYDIKMVFIINLVLIIVFVLTAVLEAVALGTFNSAGFTSMSRQNVSTAPSNGIGLPNGKVSIAGVTNISPNRCCPPAASTRLYNQLSGTIMPSWSMNVARRDYGAATLLPSGKVTLNRINRIDPQVSLQHIAQNDQNKCKPWQHKEDDRCVDNPGTVHHHGHYEPAHGEKCWVECLCYERQYPSGDSCAPCSYVGMVCTH